MQPPKPPPDRIKEQGVPGTPAHPDTPENTTPTAQGRGLAATNIATPAEAGGNKVGTMAHKIVHSVVFLRPYTTSFKVKYSLDQSRTFKGPL